MYRLSSIQRAIFPGERLVVFFMEYSPFSLFCAYCKDFNVYLLLRYMFSS